MGGGSDGACGVSPALQKALAELQKALADMNAAIERAQSMAALGFYNTAADHLYEAGDHARAAKAAAKQAAAEQVSA